MKKFIDLLLEEAQRFLGQLPSRKQEDRTHQEMVLNQIQLALYKKAAVHIISRDKQITGDISSFDPQQERLIIKDFHKNMVSLLYLRDIQKVKLLPDEVRQAQKRAKKG